MEAQSKYINNTHESQEFNQRIQDVQQQISELEQELTLPSLKAWGFFVHRSGLLR